jgi:hypothetical protein
MARVDDGAPVNPIFKQEQDVIAGYLYGLYQAAIIAANVDSAEKVELVMMGILRETISQRPMIAELLEILGLNVPV